MLLTDQNYNKHLKGGHENTLTPMMKRRIQTLAGWLFLVI